MQVRLNGDALRMRRAPACLRGWRMLRILDRMAVCAATNVRVSGKVLMGSDVRSILDLLMRPVLKAIDQLIPKQAGPIERAVSRTA